MYIYIYSFIFMQVLLGSLTWKIPVNWNVGCSQRPEAALWLPPGFKQPRCVAQLLSWVCVGNLYIFISPHNMAYVIIIYIYINK